MKTEQVATRKNYRYLVIQTPIDLIVVDGHKFTRLPFGTVINESTLMYHQWTEFSYITTRVVDGVERFAIWLSERQRITGYVIGKTTV